MRLTPPLFTPAMLIPAIWVFPRKVAFSLPWQRAPALRRSGCDIKLEFYGSSLASLYSSILVTSSPTRPTRRHHREDATRMSGVSGDFLVQLATRLPDWSAGGLLRCSAARLSVCHIVLQSPRARHARLVAVMSPASSYHLRPTRPTRPSSS